MTNIVPHTFIRLLAQASADQTSGSCQGGTFFDFPTWYKYLPRQVGADGTCRPHLETIYDIWLIVAAVIDILIRLAAIAAVVFVVWGGIKYIQSRGEPAATKEALQTIQNSIVGLVIAVAASAIVGFIAGKF